MFNPFARRRPAALEAAPVAPAATHIVRDRYTRRELLRGTESDCLAFLAAFGLCYVETL